MEKKTIGQFIAALRKASGMTQKELAEKLNVSDKAVSRWERDECAPDLSLIPVIADIFGVTADELLRGERRPKSADTEAGGNAGALPLSQKSQKLLQYMIKQSLMHYRIQCLIAAGIVVVGIIVAMIINALSEALIGFFVGLVVSVIAVIYLIAMTILALAQGHDEDLEEKTAKAYQKSLICTAYWVLCAMLAAFCSFVAPLLNGVSEVHIGRDFQYMGDEIAGTALMGAVISLVGRLILQRVLLRYRLTEVSPTLSLNQTLIIKTVSILAGVIAVTMLAEAIFMAYAQSEHLFVDGIVFEDYATFKEYMETPLPDDYGITTDSGETVFQQDYVIQEIRNSRGELLVSYTDKNQSVQVIEYNDSEDCLPITVYNYQQEEHNDHMLEIIWFPLLPVYLLEIIVAVVIYTKKRQK